MLLKRALRTYKANFHSQTRKGGSRNLNLKSMCNSTPTIHSPFSYESFYALSKNEILHRKYRLNYVMKYAL